MTKLLTSQSYNHTDYDPAMPMLTIGIARPGQPAPRITFTAILDTGADATLIPVNLLEDVAAKVVDTGYLVGISGGRLPVEIFLVTVFVADVKVRGVRAAAIEANSAPIIGRNVLNQLNVLLNGPAGTVDVLA